MDMLNEEWDKCLNLAMYAFNISPSSPPDAELKELEELHHYSG